MTPSSDAILAAAVEGSGTIKSVVTLNRRRRAPVGGREHRLSGAGRTSRRQARRRRHVQRCYRGAPAARRRRRARTGTVRRARQAARCVRQAGRRGRTRAAHTSAHRPDPRGCGGRGVRHLRRDRTLQLAGGRAGELYQQPPGRGRRRDLHRRAASDLVARCGGRRDRCRVGGERLSARSTDRCGQSSSSTAARSNADSRSRPSTYRMSSCVCATRKAPGSRRASAWTNWSPGIPDWKCRARAAP